MTAAAIAAPAARLEDGARQTPTHVKYLHHFRALAILQIIVLHAGHAFLLRGFETQIPESNPVFTAVDVLFRNATIYFTIISGIIYARIFQSRPYRPFMKARLSNTGIPYLVVSAVFTIFFWFRTDTGEGADWGALLLLIAHNAALGEAWNTLWYIPVILMLYAISPLLFHTVRAPGWRPLAVLMILLPLGFSRTDTDLSLSIIIYFMGAYVAGLWIGRDLEGAMDRVGHSAGLLALVAALATAGLTVLYLTDTGMSGPVSTREGLFYVQRLSLGLLILWALRCWHLRTGERRYALLGATASASFGLYFLHGPLVRPVVGTIAPIIPDNAPHLALILGIAGTFAGGLALSWGVIALVRLLMGSRSRWLIGA